MRDDSEERLTRATERWQERMLPLMVRMVVGLTLFFFLATLGQLLYLHVAIQQAPKITATQLAEAEATGAGVTPEFRTLALLETHALEQRYHQANVLLMARVWARYLGFTTGMILALVGAAFVLGKLREEGTQLSAKGGPGEFTLRTASPGLVMATLGVVLMVTTIVTRQEIVTADAPVYMPLVAGQPKPAIEGAKPPQSAVPNRNFP